MYRRNPRVPFWACLALVSALPAAVYAATPVSYLETSARPVYDMTPRGFTVECWIKVRSMPGFDPRIIQCMSRDPGPCGYEPSSNWELGICHLTDCVPGNLSFSLQAHGECRWVFANARVDDGFYHHVAGTYDGELIRVFVDGTEVGRKSVGRMEGNVGGGRLLIGCDRDFRNSFDGEIDEIRIWKVARSQNEIRDTMGREIDGRAEGLVACWPLNGNGADRSATRNSLRPHNYVAFPQGKLGRAADLMNVDVLRGSIGSRAIGETGR